MSGHWLVTGAGGMLARDLLALLAAEGVPAVPLDRRALDVTDRDAVHAAVADHAPEVVVNCAAYTAVDSAETDEATASAVNARGPAHLASACAWTGARLLHVSTDYVFSGDAATPYGEDDPAAPRTVYGRTKLAGEQAVLATLPATGYVVRTAWLYGAGGDNFVRAIIRLEAAKDTVDVVDDQQGQPTWTVDLARRLVAVGRSATAPPGVYHGTGGGRTTWYGLAREVFTLLGADPDRVRRTTSRAFARPAPRPAYSVLGDGRGRAAGFAPMRDWREALREAFPALLRAERP